MMFCSLLSQEGMLCKQSLWYWNLWGRYRAKVCCVNKICPIENGLWMSVCINWCWYIFAGNNPFAMTGPGSSNPFQEGQNNRVAMAQMPTTNPGFSQPTQGVLLPAPLMPLNTQQQPLQPQSNSYNPFLWGSVTRGGGNWNPAVRIYSRKFTLIQPADQDQVLAHVSLPSQVGFSFLSLCVGASVRSVLDVVVGWLVVSWLSLYWSALMCLSVMNIQFGTTLTWLLGGSPLFLICIGLEMNDWLCQFYWIQSPWS